MSIFGIILCVYFGINSIICLGGLLGFIIDKGWKASSKNILGFIIGLGIMFFVGAPFCVIKEFEEDSHE